MRKMTLKSWDEVEIRVASHRCNPFQASDSMAELIIPSCRRKDGGDYKLRLINNSGAAECTCQLTVIGKQRGGMKSAFIECFSPIVEKNL